MSTFGKAKGGGRRKTPRTRAPLLGVLSTVANDFRVGLVNLSTTGARVTAPELPAEGDDVIFRVDKLQSFGHIVWSHDGQCGVAFEGPIAATEVARLHSEGNMWGLSGMCAEQAAAAHEWELGSAR